MKIINTWALVGVAVFTMTTTYAEEAKVSQLDETKAKTTQIQQENEDLAKRVKELEGKAFSSDESVEEIDKKIQLIKAKLVKPE